MGLNYLPNTAPLFVVQNLGGTHEWNHVHLYAADFENDAKTSIYP